MLLVAAALQLPNRAHNGIFLLELKTFNLIFFLYSFFSVYFFWSVIYFKKNLIIVI